MRAHPGAHVMASVISDGASVKLRLAWLARLARILRLNGIYAFAEVQDATEIMSTAFLRRQAAPHVAQNDALTKTGRRRTSAIDKRTTRHVGYRISPSCRAMVECIFGWGKQHGTMRKTKHRGIAAVGGDFMLNLIAYNLIRIPKLIAA